MALTTNRREIVDKVCEKLKDAGHWGERIRVVDSPLATQATWQTPFCLVHPADTDFSHKASNQSFMVFNLGISAFADMSDVQWTMRGFDVDRFGILELQDDIFQTFKRINLDGLVHCAKIVRHEAAIPNDEDTPDMLYATSILMIDHFQYG